MFINLHNQEVWICEKIAANLSFVRQDGVFDFCIKNYGQTITGKATVRMEFDRTLGQTIPVVKSFRRCETQTPLSAPQYKIRKAQ
jgi:hypothetical protein